MIIVVIKGPTFTDVYQQIAKIRAYKNVKEEIAIELRLDMMPSWDIKAISMLRSECDIPMIFTLRNRSQGGSYQGSESERLEDIRRLAALKPEYLDIEHDVPSDFIQDISKHYPTIKIILSHHDCSKTPQDLDGIYQNMRKTPASFYKIAVLAQDTLDALRFVCWAKQKGPQLIAISMGPHGQISRLIGHMTYAPIDLDQQTAPGQLSLKTLLERRRYPSTNIYGLIGDPVEHSISDDTHNHWMNSSNINACYVKFQVSPNQLAQFFAYAKQLPIKGLSVTMPLKEHVMPFLTSIDPQAKQIGAVNTLCLKKDQIIGFNTDCIGALNAVEKVITVKGKRIVMLGAGGAAKAIAYEAHKRGALLTILNRNVDRAQQMAQQFQGVGKGLHQMAECASAGYDILINCIPIPMPISPEHLLPQAIIMDTKTKPKETELIKHARAKGCQIVHGYEMFFEQAIGQFCLWFSDRAGSSESRQILEDQVLAVLEY